MQGARRIEVGPTYYLRNSLDSIKMFSYLLWLLPLVSASSVPYSQYILAPSSRAVKPHSIRYSNGTVKNAEALVGSGHSSALFTGINSSVTLDFGKNIGGNVKFEVTSVSSSDQWIGFTFTESSLWISPYTCDATQNSGLDEPLWFQPSRKGVYEADKYHQRGGFRYMSIWHNTTGSISISSLTVNWTTSPEMDDPRDYKGYFHSSSDKLNRVWYAGAYTNQLCSVTTDTGNSLRLPLEGWEYNATIASQFI